ncbi:hypothetical protein [Thalassobacillus sp. C254]|uniref:hypothetical protein n=1 Tax=Thalassobacillus sp. C254 TaxID=1225341 RepID=UPI00277D0C10|nr:hypothetical protein [Thalassobacillus sp. C254]
MPAVYNIKKKNTINGVSAMVHGMLLVRVRSNNKWRERSASMDWLDNASVGFLVVF